MRLIDDDVGDIHVTEVLLEEARGETLGGYIEEFVVAIGGVVESEVDIAFCHSGIDGYGADTAVAQVLDLVLHEGYERSHHKGKSRLHHGRNLETDGLASSGRENGEHVTAFHCRLHYFLLFGTKAVVAPIFLQNLSCCHHRSPLPPLRHFFYYFIRCNHDIVPDLLTVSFVENFVAHSLVETA